MSENKKNDETVILNDKTVIKHQIKDITKPSISPSLLKENTDFNGRENPTNESIIQDKTPIKSKNSIGIGSTINNRFTIDRLLGKGGMGIVYRALDIRKQEAKDRDPYVAIKILNDELKDHPQFFIALQREARKSQTLAHPNIITVYDFDRDDETVYMTMEILKGVSLEDFIKNNPNGVSIKSACKIIQDIAQGLSYAHANKIIHSDLKPGNIFISDDGSAKVLDFGIARAMTNLSDIASDKTLFDAAQLGGLTPTYASVAMFEGKEPHPSDDIYALGLISYELLTGRHPYQRKPASIAIIKHKKVTKVKGLKNHQWSAIASAIELKRENRNANAEQFLAKFNGTPSATRNLILVLILTITIIGSAMLVKKPKEGPEIPFASLPQQVQQNVEQALYNGNQSLKFNDYNGALHYFNYAYELHPKNKASVEGLNFVVDKVLLNIKNTPETHSDESNLKQVNTLLGYSSLSNNQVLKNIKKELEGE